MSDPARMLLASQVLVQFLTQSLVTTCCSNNKVGVGGRQGWRWVLDWIQRHSTPTKQRDLLQMNGFEELEQLGASQSVSSFIDLVDGIFKGRSVAGDDAQI